MASTMVFRAWSCLHRYLPSPNVFKQQLRMCSRFPRLEHSGYADGSTLPYMWRFDGLGSTSYTAWIRNFMRCGSAFHSSAQVTFLLTAFSHLDLTSSWTWQCPSSPLLICGVEDPSPAWLCVTTSTSLFCSLASASLTAFSALHFLPVFTRIPCLATFGLLESWYCTTSLAFVTLNSSSKDLKGSSWENAMLIHPGFELPR